jgi:phosphoenolpyruvate-protein kinase (PTS system EI component)
MDSTGHQPQLLDQTVVVIGGSAGIGLETARRARAEGTNELSVSPHSVAIVKARVRVLDLARCTSLAEAALDADDAAAVRQLVSSADSSDHSAPNDRTA